MAAIRQFPWRAIPALFLIAGGGFVGFASLLMLVIGVFSSGMPYVPEEAGHAQAAFVLAGLALSAMMVAFGHFVLRGARR